MLHLRKCRTRAFWHSSRFICPRRRALGHRLDIVLAVVVVDAVTIWFDPTKTLIDK